MPSTPAHPERILVVGNGFLGDTVLGIPFFRNLRRRFPDAVIDVLLEPAAAAVLAHCPYHDEILSWPRPPRSQRLLPTALSTLVGQAAWLRSRGYTRAYLFKRSFSSALLVRLAGIPWRVGHAAEGRGWLLSRAVGIRRGRHQVEVFLDLLRVDGIEIDDGHNENWVAEADRAAIAALLAEVPAGRPKVFVAVRSTNAGKHWPLDRWAAVVEWLVTARNGEIFFCGGPADVAMHAEIVERLDPAVARHVHDHSASVRLRQVGALLERMDLCVGVDSGLPHLAASHGVPVVALFGPTDPAQWHPWQTGGAAVQAPRGGGSMADIDVEQVVAAASRLLGTAERQAVPPSFDATLFCPPSPPRERYASTV
ncbi:MAG: glycosyltransferase family 9 protein [Planctomycetia bacterium]